MKLVQRRRLAAVLGSVGSFLGVLAGTTQIVAGHAIPQWTGDKLDTVPLGGITIVLSLVAGLAARRQQRSDLTVLARAGWALGLIGPGLLCLSTVGRLWYFPALLLVSAGVLTVNSWRSTVAPLLHNWHRVLLSLLGGFEMLMAAGASPVLMVIGGLGGLALIASAWLPTRSSVVVGLAAVGTVPFAVTAWTAVVPVVILLLTAWQTMIIVRTTRSPSPGARISH